MLWRSVTTVIVLLLTSVGLVDIGAAASPDRELIRVPPGDSSALYSAVFDGGRPRTGAEIVLEGGTYRLDGRRGPSAGRLVLGRNTVLRSSLELADGPGGVPTGDVVTSGAVINTVKLKPGASLPFDVPGAIVMHADSMVDGLTIRNSGNPSRALIAIDIVRRGTVQNAIVERHFQGVRARITGVTGDRTEATIAHSVLRTNDFAIVAISADPVNGADNATVQVSIRNNLVQKNDDGVFVPGAVGDADGGTSGTHITLSSTGNIYENNKVGLAIQGALASPVSAVEDSATELKSQSDIVADNGVGLSAVGAGRSPFTSVGEIASANTNRAMALMTNTAFKDNELDVEAFGSASFEMNSTVGEGNRGEVRLANTAPTASQLSRSVIACAFFGDDGPPVPIEPCPNSAKIVPPN